MPFMPAAAWASTVHLYGYVTNVGALKHDFSIRGRKTRLLSHGQSDTLRITFLRKGQMDAAYHRHLQLREPIRRPTRQPGKLLVSGQVRPASERQLPTRIRLTRPAREAAPTRALDRNGGRERQARHRARRANRSHRS